MAALTLFAFIAFMACFFWWWRARTTATGGLAVLALAALVAVAVFLMSAPHPAAN
jgi:hypothetical protein